MFKQDSENQKFNDMIEEDKGIEFVNKSKTKKDLGIDKETRAKIEEKLSQIDENNELGLENSYDKYSLISQLDNISDSEEEPEINFNPKMMDQLEKIYANQNNYASDEDPMNRVDGIEELEEELDRHDFWAVNKMTKAHEKNHLEEAEEFEDNLNDTEGDKDLQKQYGAEAFFDDVNMNNLIYDIYQNVKNQKGTTTKEKLEPIKKLEEKYNTGDFISSKLEKYFSSNAENVADNLNYFESLDDKADVLLTPIKDIIPGEENSAVELVRNLGKLETYLAEGTHHKNQLELIHQVHQFNKDKENKLKADVKDFYINYRTTKVIELDNPYTGEIISEIPLIDKKQANLHIDNAKKAQLEWQSTTLEQRIDVCKSVMSYFEENRDTIATQITSQMGKPLQQAQNEINGMFERINKMIEFSHDALKPDEFVTDDGFFKQIVKEPVGVVLVIAPWNYPLLTAANSIFPAILAGNSVIIKHSARTPLCGNHFTNAFNAADVPKGLVNNIDINHKNLNHIVRHHPSIGFVSFTGSVEGGMIVNSNVSKSRFINSTLELGGKDPAYVAKDTDLDFAVGSIIDGGFYNAGQSCCGIERVYVHEDHYDAFIEKAIPIVQNYQLGDPLLESTTLGPMAQQKAIRHLQDQVDEANILGAEILTGGYSTHDSAGKGRFFQPTLLSNCNHNQSIMLDESFGPVLGIQSVKNDEEAITLMNDSRFGLTSAIYTNDKERALSMGKQLKSGTIFMNRCDYLDPDLPWTGYTGKDTGKGASLSKYGFDGVINLKAYNFKL
eukprot:TRINITY_DN416_c0_g1_i1.p1 TRINITY_DN416_c0_g1~~TRINITY_DN416_c0_g1_i1.p1  ORF type:complete len:782 (+),score=291.30 TRINITY_DN416_c0_g1_i1:960-3305(+)